MQIKIDISQQSEFNTPIEIDAGEYDEDRVVSIGDLRLTMNGRQFDRLRTEFRWIEGVTDEKPKP